MEGDEKENGEFSVEDTEKVYSLIELAEKTFGSYHVAALLCKMDYTLWLRAGDAAMNIANLHSRCLSLPPIIKQDPNMRDEDNSDKKRFSRPEEYIQHHQAEKMRWLEEAKDDYLAADNIHPPGITVPCKLSNAHIHLGNISEALTILTDLKKKSLKYKHKKCDSDNNEEKVKPRSELEKSYAAWLLYADLMLRIGYECSKWNKGDQTNNNYMFRRWLRKYSSTFDWRERRLQALCLALEAATGTKCCEGLVDWMHDRADDKDDTYEMIDEQPEKAKGDSTGNNEMDVDNKADYHVTQVDDSMNDNKIAHRDRLALNELDQKFQKERQELVSQFRHELELFDKCTSDSNLVEDVEAEKDRDNKRKQMLENHKIAILNLSGQHQLEKNAHLSAHREEHENQKMQLIQPLPLSASCATVCDIASQLIKLCLGMELYIAGKLVAEAVSLYFKERAVRSEKRFLVLKDFGQRQIAASSNILQLTKETYDDLHEESSNALEDDDSIAYLSDDDEFQSEEGENILQSMKHGQLPSELQVLYSLCLIGIGGNEFLAAKLFGAITSLDEREDDSSQSNYNNRGTSEEISFQIFRHAMVNNLSKPAAFAFVTDLLLKMKKEQEWAHHLLPIFECYFKRIEDSEEVTILQINPSSLSLCMSTKRSFHVKTLLAILRMKLYKAQKKIEGVETYTESLSKAVDITMSIIDTIYQYRLTLLLEINKRKINDESIEALKILSQSMAIICKYLNRYKESDQAKLVNLLTKLRTAACWICQSTIPNHDDIYSSSIENVTESWRYFPISSEWQTDEHMSLSKRSYNLCVSCSVSAFSGWEKSEFDLNLLRRNQGPSFFGVNVKGVQVSGYLHKNVEVELASQWKLLEKLLPTLATIDFSNAINDVKQADWYVKAVENLESKFENVPISSFGEEHALNILVTYSRVCLLVALLEKDELRRQCLIKNAMSVVIPLSQFCLDQSLWDSNIGTSATRNDSISEWEHFAQTSDATVAPKPCRQKGTSAKKYSISKPQSKSKDTYPQKYKSTSPLTKLIKISVEILLKEWNGKDNFSDSDDDENDARLNVWSQTVSGPAKLAMKRVDFTLRKLRQSVTIHALQKASLQVAAALLDLIIKKECQNPFLCLHQAAVFASQGSKGGNNDEEFKRPLPEENECTPVEALMVLGRADCLRAIHFTDEAIYICSYVAKVCRLHRDKTKSEFPWTPKWRVIGILMYTVSMAIDATICSFMEGENRANWVNEVKAEISRARTDAIGLQKAFSRTSSKAKGFSKGAAISTKDNLQNKEDLDDNYEEEVEEFVEDVYVDEEELQDGEYNEDEDYDDDDDNISLNDAENENNDLSEEGLNNDDGYVNQYMDVPLEIPGVDVAVPFDQGNETSSFDGTDVNLENVTCIPV